MGGSVGEEPLGKWRRRPVPRRRPAAAAPLPTYPAGEAGSSQPLALQVTCPRAHLLEMLFSTVPRLIAAAQAAPPRSERSASLPGELPGEGFRPRCGSLYSPCLFSVRVPEPFP